MLSRAEKIVLTRKSVAVRRTFPITLRPSPTTSGRPEKSPLSRVICATPRTASTLVPMAMEQSAFLRAGMSLTPSPVMATVWPSSWRADTSFFFWSGVTRPKTRASRTALRMSSSSKRVEAST